MRTRPGVLAHTSSPKDEPEHGPSFVDQAMVEQRERSRRRHTYIRARTFLGLLGTCVFAGLRCAFLRVACSIQRRKAHCRPSRRRGVGFEIRCSESYQGFESLALR